MPLHEFAMIERRQLMSRVARVFYYATREQVHALPFVEGDGIPLDASTSEGLKSFLTAFVVRDMQLGCSHPEDGVHKPNLPRNGFMYVTQDRNFEDHPAPDLRQIKEESMLSVTKRVFVNAGTIIDVVTVDDVPKYALCYQRGRSGGGGGGGGKMVVVRKEANANTLTSPMKSPHFYGEPLSPGEVNASYPTERGQQSVTIGHTLVSKRGAARSGGGAPASPRATSHSHSPQAMSPAEQRLHDLTHEHQALLLELGTAASPQAHAQSPTGLDTYRHHHHHHHSHSANPGTPLNTHHTTPHSIVHTASPRVATPGYAMGDVSASTLGDTAAVAWPLSPTDTQATAVHYQLRGAGVETVASTGGVLDLVAATSPTGTPARGAVPYDPWPPVTPVHGYAASTVASVDPGLPIAAAAAGAYDPGFGAASPIRATAAPPPAPSAAPPPPTRCDLLVKSMSIQQTPNPEQREATRRTIDARYGLVPSPSRSPSPGGGAGRGTAGNIAFDYDFGPVARDAPPASPYLSTSATRTRHASSSPPRAAAAGGGGGLPQLHPCQHFMLCPELDDRAHVDSWSHPCPRYYETGACHMQGEASHVKYYTHVLMRSKDPALQRPGVGFGCSASGGGGGGSDGAMAATAILANANAPPPPHAQPSKQSRVPPQLRGGSASAMGGMSATRSQSRTPQATGAVALHEEFKGTQEEHSAAAKIQARYRGGKVRSRSPSPAKATPPADAALHEEFKGTQEEHSAATKIQARYRGGKVRSRSPSPAKAAEVAALREEFKGTNEEHAAAAKIQARYRGGRVRSRSPAQAAAAASAEAAALHEEFKGTQEEHSAAAKIQARYRGGKVRSRSPSPAKAAEVAALREEFKGTNEEHAAAAKIQARYRGGRVRSRSPSPAGAGGVVGASSASASAALHEEFKGTQEEHSAATKIQARYRGGKARSRSPSPAKAAEVAALREEFKGTNEEHAAAAKIQARYRGGRVRSRSPSPAKVGAESAALHGEFKGTQEEHSAATKIQARYRGGKARSRSPSPAKAAGDAAALHEEFKGTQEEHAAAAKIQARYRGMQSRSRSPWRHGEGEAEEHAGYSIQLTTHDAGGRVSRNEELDLTSTERTRTPRSGGAGGASTPHGVHRGVQVGVCARRGRDAGMFRPTHCKPGIPSPSSRPEGSVRVGARGKATAAATAAGPPRHGRGKVQPTPYATRVSTPTTAGRHTHTPRRTPSAAATERAAGGGAFDADNAAVPGTRRTGSKGAGIRRAAGGELRGDGAPAATAATTAAGTAIPVVSARLPDASRSPAGTSHGGGYQSCVESAYAAPYAPAPAQSRTISPDRLPAPTVDYSAERALLRAPHTCPVWTAQDAPILPTDAYVHGAWARRDAGWGHGVH